MAANINMVNGRASLYLAQKSAWHGLGTVCDEAQNSREAMRISCLDHTMEKWPMEATCPRTGRKVETTSYAVVRADTGALMGVVGERYKVLQNHEAFEFMDALISEGATRYESAGALGAGERVWVLARMPNVARVGSDTVEGYALLVNSHDGSGAVKVLPTTVRVVCQNTLTLALRQSSRTLSIRHDGKLSARIGAAKRAIGLVSDRLDQFGAEMKQLAAVNVGDKGAKQYFGALFPTDPYRIDPSLLEVAPRTAPAPRPFTLPPGASLLDSILDGANDTFDVVETLLSGDKRAQLDAAEKQAAKNRDILRACISNFGNQRNDMPGISGSLWSAYNAVSEYADHQRPNRGRNERARMENRLESVWMGTANDVKQDAYTLALNVASGAAQLSA